MPAGLIELTPELTRALPSRARGSGLNSTSEDLGFGQCNVKFSGASPNRCPRLLVGENSARGTPHPRELGWQKGAGSICVKFIRQFFEATTPH